MLDYVRKTLNVPADLRPVFAKHGLDGLVDSYTHSFEVGAEKPSPAIFLAAAKSLGTCPVLKSMTSKPPSSPG